MNTLVYNVQIKRGKSLSPQIVYLTAPNPRLSGHADPPTSQRYFERCITWPPLLFSDSQGIVCKPPIAALQQ